MMQGSYTPPPGPKPTPPNPPPEDLHDAHLAGEDTGEPPWDGAEEVWQPVRRRIWWARARSELCRAALPAIVGVAVGWWVHHAAHPPAGPPLPDMPPVVLADTIRADSAFLALAGRLEHEEGYRSHIYKDATGHRTIGYGTNLEIGITREEARELLESRLAQALDCFRRLWPPFETEPRAVQLALADMAYQLGCSGAASFRRFLAALQHGEISTAVAELRESRWYEETPRRVENLIETIRRER